MSKPVEAVCWHVVWTTFLAWPPADARGDSWSRGFWWARLHDDAPVGAIEAFVSEESTR